MKEHEGASRSIEEHRGANVASDSVFMASGGNLIKETCGEESRRGEERRGGRRRRRSASCLPAPLRRKAWSLILLFTKKPLLFLLSL